MIQRAKLISHTNAGIALSHFAYFYQALWKELTKKTGKSTTRRA
jgi:hypothetical protein